MRAWTFQDHRQKQKLGDKAPWFVGWMEDDGNRQSKKFDSRQDAEKFRRKKMTRLAIAAIESPQKSEGE